MKKCGAEYKYSVPALKNGNIIIQPLEGGDKK